MMQESRGGKIRFVGGRRHNQVIDMHDWPLHVVFPVPQPVVSFKKLSGPISMNDCYVRTEEYTLTPMNFGRHCRFYEYVLCGQGPDETPWHWRIGNDLLAKAERAFLRVAGRLSHVLHKYR